MLLGEVTKPNEESLREEVMGLSETMNAIISLLGMEEPEGIKEAIADVFHDSGVGTPLSLVG